MHAYTWKLLKPHMLDIIKHVIFPILQFTEADEELWELPKDYIRTKFGMWKSPTICYSIVVDKFASPFTFRYLR